MENQGTWRRIGLVALAVAIAGCDEGGGGGGDADGGLGADVAALEGTFVQGQCSPLRPGTSGRMRLVVERTADAAIRFSQGALEYIGESCEGEGSSAGDPTPLGTVVFDASGANATLAFHRGTWATPSGTTSRSVWALEGGARLCLLGDQTPTVFPDAASVEDYLAILPDSVCYTRR